MGDNMHLLFDSRTQEPDPSGEGDGSGPSVTGGGIGIEVYGSESLDMDTMGIPRPVANPEGMEEDEDEDDDHYGFDTQLDQLLQPQQQAEFASQQSDRNQMKRKKKRKTAPVVVDEDDELVEVNPSPSVASKVSLSKSKVKTKLSNRIGKKKSPTAVGVSSIPVDEEDDDTDSSADVPEGTDLKKTFKAPIWEHYVCRIENRKRRANCKYCGVAVPCHSKRNGTSSARSHNASCNRNPFNEKNKLRQSVLNFKPQAPGAPPSPYVGNWVFDTEKATDAFVKKAIIDEDPMCVYQKKGWQLIAEVALPPYFKLPKRTSLTRLCLALYERMKSDLKQFFSSTKQRISMTTDTWTSSNQKLCYMTVTAHYIDADFKLQKKILNFVPIVSHKGDDLAYTLEACLRDEWGIESVYCITMDNASSNDVLARNLKENLIKWGTDVAGGDHIHMRCNAHIINLVVVDGMKEDFRAISVARACAAYIRRSSQRIKNFKECAAKEKVPFKKHLWLDSPTRWNGVFDMLERAYYYRDVFDRYAKMDPNLAVELTVDGLSLPTKEDWACVGRLVQFLGHFSVLTKKVSGSWYMTSNLCLPEISDMFVKLKDLELSRDQSIKGMAKKMLEKFNKYWGDPRKMNMNLFFGVILDPRHKFEGLNYILENLYGLVVSPMHSVVIKSEMGRLFKEYAKNTPQTSSASTSTATTLSTGSVQPSGGLRTMAALMQQRQKQTSNAQHQRTELDKYIDEDLEPFQERFDVLNWWKVNSARLPVLAAMAKDVLAVPVTSVASESAFSTGGRVLSPYRSSLTPKTVECLICAQDWLSPRGAPQITIEEDFDKLTMLEEGEVVQDDDSQGYS